MIIRALTKDDIFDIKRILHETLLYGQKEANRVALSMLKRGKIALGAEENGKIVGIIGAIQQYGKTGWELHPLGVLPEHQRCGVGSKLVSVLEQEVLSRGGVMIYLGSDDERGTTSLFGVDLYEDTYGKISAIKNIDNHPYTFYEKQGYKIVGVFPDANGIGKPDIWLAKTIKKKMSDLTDEDRVRLYPIILTQYNSQWAKWFKDEKARIENMIGIENIISIKHIGSTSVKGLIAKPTIDILLEIQPQTDLQKLKASFPYPEYICIDNQTIPSNDLFLIMMGYTPEGFAKKVFHIHIRYKGDWDEEFFRDYLVAHPDTAAEYAELKLNLKDKYQYDRDGYTNAKGKFIADITAKAREYEVSK